MKDNTDYVLKIIGLSLIAALLCLSIAYVSATVGMQESYKRGQLDYQAGKIEWIVIDGAVHHIEGEK